MIRKVYMLPKELVDRIASFQQDKRLPSEVEAVRRLLDEALLYRDTPLTIVERFKDKLKANGLLRAVVRDLLAEHPLVTSISYEEADAVVFSLKDAGSFRIDTDGSSFHQSGGYGGAEWDAFPPRPKRITSVSMALGATPGGNSDMDDEIPF